MLDELNFPARRRALPYTLLVVIRAPVRRTLSVSAVAGLVESQMAVYGPKQRTFAYWPIMLFNKVNYSVLFMAPSVLLSEISSSTHPPFFFSYHVLTQASPSQPSMARAGAAHSDSTCLRRSAAGNVLVIHWAHFSTRVDDVVVYLNVRNLMRVNKAIGEQPQLGCVL